MDTQTIKQIFDLTGKSAVVTGSAKGMGKGIALRLGEAGAFVIVADVDLDGAKETAAEIQSASGKAAALKLDLTKFSEAESFTDLVVKAGGSYDILVNCAGIYPTEPFMSIKETSWDKVVDINLKGPYFYAQAAAEVMIQAEKGGKIINIASLDAVKPSWFHTHYAASKGGMTTLTKALALELGAHHINVNAVCPGPILTPGLEKALKEYAPPGVTVEQVIQETASRMPLGRFGDPDDIAKVVLFLASSASDFITGETILVDGGSFLMQGFNSSQHISDFDQHLAEEGNRVEVLAQEFLASVLLHQHPGNQLLEQQQTYSDNSFDSRLDGLVFKPNAHWV